MGPRGERRLRPEISRLASTVSQGNTMLRMRATPVDGQRRWRSLVPVVVWHSSGRSLEWATLFRCSKYERIV